MEICCDIEKMVHDAQLRVRYEAQRPDPAVVEALQAARTPVTVVVVFGFWCPDSLRIVAEVLKAVTEAGNDNLQLLAVSVPYGETEDMPLSVGGLSVRKFPTVAFLRGRYQTTGEIDPAAEMCRFVEESLDAARVRCLAG